MKNKVSPDGYLIIFSALAILFHYIFPIQRIIPHPYDNIGIVIIVMGIAMTLHVNYLLLKSGTSTEPYGSPSSLVSSGLFKFSRNPLYLGMAIALFGAAILLGSISPFAFPLLFIVIMDRFFIPMEEKNLERKFGKKYDDYKKRVRRWI